MIVRFETVIVLLILAAPSLLAQGANGKLLALERDRYDAMVAADIERLDSMLADDLVFTHASANQDSKVSFLKKISEGQLIYRKITIDAGRVQDYGDSGVVTGRSVLEITVRGEDRRLEMLFTTAWVRFEDGWKVVAYQSTFDQ